MTPVHPEFTPDPTLSTDAMTAMQRDIADAATFADALTCPVPALAIDSGAGEAIIAGVDQAFLDDRAVSAIVAMQGDTVVERVYAVEPLTIPYIPGLLSFREGGPILAAIERLSVEPAVVLFDGSGRIHYRQAGLATHLGVLLDVPSIGVAKGLLCGDTTGPTADLSTGEQVPIIADDRVEAPKGTRLGYAVQTRTFPDARQVNPVYVSAGHRISAETAASVVCRSCAGYKLPEPIRLADRYAGALREDLARES